MIASMLGEGWIVDGYDVSSSAREAARKRSEPGVVYEAIDDIPTGIYGGIVVSSVLQYQEDDAAVVELFIRFRRWLSEDSKGVVITDVVTPSGSRMNDAWDLVRSLVHRLGVSRAAGALLQTFRRSPGGLLCLDPKSVAKAARTAGLEVRHLETNLSPFSRRASFELSLPQSH